MTGTRPALVALTAVLLVLASTVLQSTEQPSDQDAAVAAVNATVPASRIFEHNGVRYQQFGQRLAIPLHPGLTRAWGAGYPDVQMEEGRKIYLTRPPFVMFALLAESPYRWYQGIPTRDCFAALRNLNRHPLSP